MTHPFELGPEELTARLEEMVDATFDDLASEFLLMPKGDHFIRYPEFRDAYEVLKRHTASFSAFTAEKAFAALVENSRGLGVIRAILGMTPPEWAELAHAEFKSDITQGAARQIDRQCRETPDFVAGLTKKYKSSLWIPVTGGTPPIKSSKTLSRIEALVEAAVYYIAQGAPEETDGVIHRLAKFDTQEGFASVEYTANEGVPYAVLLYERYLGRPFAGHRDSVSELVGEVMENAVEQILRDAKVSYRKTKRAEKIPGFGQAPDFCIPDEKNPIAVVEAKITSDDGTARDKVTRIRNLVTQRDKHVAKGKPSYEVIACIDGRGFRVRREDMRQMLLDLQGKLFTSASLDKLVAHTRIRELVTKPE